MTVSVEKDSLSMSRIEDLHGLLIETAVDMEQLYASLRSQQKAIVEWDFTALTRNIGEQRKLGQRNKERDKRRRELIKQLAGSPDVTIHDLAESLGRPWSSRLDDAALRIRGTVDNVGAMKKQNEFLLEKARSMVNGQLRLFMELARINRNMYEESGKKSRQSNLHKVFDQKI